MVLTSLSKSTVHARWLQTLSFLVGFNQPYTVYCKLTVYSTGRGFVMSLRYRKEKFGGGGSGGIRSVSEEGGEPKCSVDQA